ncbi:hypothetical protein CDD81_20 [Ophiocordyceps australis]|uniref:Major facilitator superfamily (MFS) profile domain-containing protein n=1 Tax=Ophiocordyceps australis TaxID=1399860 RepID=A0A2C5YKF7_9HYPO|nr:hypothetical protein CDD81_20 [Ophiocordyceps australis]
MNSAGVYQSWLARHQLAEANLTQIGWIFGFYNFFSFFAGVALGPTLDAQGPRLVTLGGAMLLLALYASLGLCRSYWHFFLCFGLLGSLSTSMLFTAAMATVQQCFSTRRGLATGIAISGGSVGGIVSPLVLGSLLPRVGFAWATRAVALIMVPFLAAALALVRGHGPVSPRVGNEALQGRPSEHAILTARVLVISVGAFFVELAMFIPVTYIVSYACAHNMSVDTAYTMTTLLNLGSMLGRWLPGWAGDGLGYFNTQIAALALCLAAILGLWMPFGGSLAGLVVFVLLFGLGSGSGISLVPVCIAQLCHGEAYARTFTCVYSIGSFG